MGKFNGVARAPFLFDGERYGGRCTLEVPGSRKTPFFYAPLRWCAAVFRSWPLRLRPPSRSLSLRVARRWRGHRHLVDIERQEVGLLGVIGADLTGFDVIHPAMDEQLPAGQFGRYGGVGAQVVELGDHVFL